MPYGPHTAGDRERMLAALGIASVDELFADIPDALRASPLSRRRSRAGAGPGGPAAGPRRAEPRRPRRASWAPASTATGARRPSTRCSSAASGTRPTRRTSPRSARARSRASTSTSRCSPSSTDLDVVSASHYDGAAATAEAALMTCRATRRERVLVSRGVHPHYRGDRSRRTSRGGPRARRDPARRRRAAAGTTDLEALERLLADPGPARSPGSSPRSPTSSGSSSRCRGSASSPTPPAPCSSRSSSRSRSPSSRLPARTARTSRPARASRSASRPSTAARTSGILASTDALVRQIPGRLVGMTTDLDGRRAFVMTMRAREQDIRRDKAASNICTNQALLALAASIYLATIGPHGLRDVAAIGAARAAELETALAAAGAPRLHPGPYLNEFAVRVPDARAVHRTTARPRDPRRARPRRRRTGRPVARRRPAGLRDRGHDPGRDRAVRERPARRAVPSGGAADERHRRDACSPPSSSVSRPGRGGGKIPHPPTDALDRIPAAARRATPPALPELNEPEVVRHYVNLSSSTTRSTRASTRSARAR